MTTKNATFNVGVELTTGEKDIYQSPEGRGSIINFTSVANDDTSPHTLTVWVVKYGESTALNRLRVPQQDVEGKSASPIFALRGFRIPPKAIVKAKADANSVMSMALSGSTHIDKES